VDVGNYGSTKVTPSYVQKIKKKTFLTHNEIMAELGWKGTAYGRMLTAKAAARKARKQLRDDDGYPRKAINAFVGGEAMQVPGRRVSGRGAYRRTRRRITRRRRAYGRGGFFGDILGGAASAINSAFIPKHWGIGTPQTWGRLGSGLGDAAWDVYSGRGAYNDPSPNARIDQGIPDIANPGGSDGCIVVRHKEWICDVVSTGAAFNMAATLPINPGLTGTFPWLAQIASSFTQYQLQGMMFYFRSTSGALSTTQALGEIIMAINYNAGDVAFTNKQQMLNEVMATSTVPSQDSVCAVECDGRQTPLQQMYIRSGALTTQDIRFYDWGTFYVATQGQSAGVTLGELWCTYQVALYKPQIQSVGTGGGCQTAHYTANTYTNAAPLKSAAQLYDNIGITFNGATGTIISLPQNLLTTYMLLIHWVGNSTACTAPAVTLSAGLVANSIQTGANYGTSNTATTVTDFYLCYTFNNPQNVTYMGTFQGGVVQTITLGTGGTLPASGTKCDIFLLTMNPNIL